MVAFSRMDSLKKAVKKKQYRARIQAKQGHSDMKLKHPDWVRDAQLPTANYAQMNAKIKEECEKAQARQRKFTEDLYSHD